MSGSEKRKAQASMTALCILGALVLYVATWPVIHIRAELDRARGTFFSDRTPPPSFLNITWVNRVYYPLNWLREIRVFGKVTPDNIDELLTNPNGRNPLQWYYTWWVTKLDPDGLLFQTQTVLNPLLTPRLWPPP